MDFDYLMRNIGSILYEYRIHVLVFLIALFIGLTFAHPVLTMNDEWITANQMVQLHSGHQVLINEGKYGLYQNGSISKYFEIKSNVLAYPLFLPLISLPTFWLIDITAEHFVFFILFLWTIIALLIILLLDIFFRQHTFIGKWRWTPALVIAAFLLFFINLLYYSSFPVEGIDTFPEVEAIVFTNIILFSLMAVMIYEINNVIFDDLAYSLFGTAVCISSSSYLFWTTSCKDHILVATIFIGIILCIIQFQKIKDFWYLPLAFILSGLLAWARPEFAIWIFLMLLVFCVSIFLKYQKTGIKKQEKSLLFWAPLFTIIGALPFFVNNYMVTKNFLIPAWILWEQDALPVAVSSSLSEPLTPGNGNMIQSIWTLMFKMISINPNTFFSDLFGIFFHPLNGSVGVFPFVPLFVITSILIIILTLCKKMQFSPQDNRYLYPLTLMAIGVFLAYFVRISSMNVSHGMTPDMRYLSPLYVLSLIHI